MALSLLKSLRSAYSSLNPEEVRKLAERSIAIELVADSEEAYSTMESYFLPAKTFEQDRALGLITLHRATNPNRPAKADLTIPRKTPAGPCGLRLAQSRVGVSGRARERSWGARRLRPPRRPSRGTGSSTGCSAPWATKARARATGSPPTIRFGRPPTSGMRATIVSGEAVSVTRVARSSASLRVFFTVTVPPPAAPAGAADRDGTPPRPNGSNEQEKDRAAGALESATGVETHR